MYCCHLFLISSASVRAIPFLSFIVLIFAWNVPLVSRILLKRSLVFPIPLFSSISLHWSLREVFLFFLAILVKTHRTYKASQVALVVKNLPVLQEMWEMQVRPLGQEDPLKEGMASHSSILAWRNPMDRGPGGAIVYRVTNSWTWLKQLSTHA